MDQPTLVAAMGNKYISDEEVTWANRVMILSDVTTVLRAAMFWAQMGHESDSLQTYEEYASGDAYEGRVDLGNIQVGDGRRFKGRGIVQCTGRANYALFSQWAYDNGHSATPDQFVRFPERVAQLENAFLVAVWYWTTQRPLNTLADAGDVVGATRAIQGGSGGLADRQARYSRCLKLGDALLPAMEGDDMTGEAEAINYELKGPEGKGWEVTLYDKVAGSVKKTLVAMVGDIYTKILSALPVVGDVNHTRPRPLDQADDIFGHVLSLRAQVDENTRLLKQLTEDGKG